MGMADVRSWFKGNRKRSRKSISRPYRRLFLEELEDRSLLSASFTASTLAIIDGREFLLPSERLGNAYRIIGTVGNYEEFTVGLGAPISITGLATADGTIVYEVVNETSGRPSWPGIMAGHAQSLLSGALTSTTLSAPFISAGIGKMATTLPVNLASIALSANQGFAADSANSEFNTRSLPFMPLSMTNVNGTLFIQGEENGAVELWRSDGTADGTILLNSFAPTFYYGMLNRGEHAVVKRQPIEGRSQRTVVAEKRVLRNGCTRLRLDLRLGTVFAADVVQAVGQRFGPERLLHYFRQRRLEHHRGRGGRRDCPERELHPI